MKKEGNIGDQVIVETIKISTEHSGEVINIRAGTIIARYREYETRTIYVGSTETTARGNVTTAELYVVLFDNGTVERGFVREELKLNAEHEAW